jgi:release factor glutamine methyltransferase
MQNFSDGKIPVGDNKASSLRKYAFTALQSMYDTSELVNIVNWILEHFTGMTRTQLLNEPDALVNQSTLIHFSNAIDQLKKGMPVQYVVGEIEFYGLKLYVNPSVLIPRPETEELVDLIVKENQSLEGLKILDIGTGSGCIALSLAKYLKSAKVIAIDLSAGALEVAKKNAGSNQITNVEFLELDVFKEDNFIEKEFDLIVSNPPYIAASERSTLSPNVLEHEPSMALFVPDSNPLVFYERIVQLAEVHLKKHGKIYVEINERLGTETSKIFHPDSFSSIHLLNDLFEKNRFIKVEKL